ncbi:hypothetical protein C4E44_20030 [Pseudomonas sp. MWU12-2312b]|nr:hypothetical protein F7R06_21480 [Pseudomonas moorei]PPA02329.1 hypothetical protein C4E44_20030 [Pseudomonas sp. MWU12-2312b]
MGRSAVDPDGGLTANPVGASLLAMADCQSTVMLNVKPLSRASSLPLLFCVVYQFCETGDQFCPLPSPSRSLVASSAPARPHCCAICSKPNTA